MLVFWPAVIYTVTHLNKMLQISDCTGRFRCGQNYFFWPAGNNASHL